MRYQSSSRTCQQEEFFGAIWFFMLFLAAVTSSLSMLQPALTFVQEALGLSRGAAAAAVTTFCVAGNIFVLWFSEGLIALNTIDFWVGTFLIFAMAGAQVVLFGWVFGVDRGLIEAQEGAHIRIPVVYRFIIKYVSPTYLLLVFIGFLWQNLPDRQSTDKKITQGWLSRIAADRTIQLSLLVVLAVMGVLVVVLAMGERRWRQQGKDLDGLRPPDDG